MSDTALIKRVDASGQWFLSHYEFSPQVSTPFASIWSLYNATYGGTARYKRPLELLLNIASLFPSAHPNSHLDGTYTLVGVEELRDGVRAAAHVIRWLCTAYEFHPLFDDATLGDACTAFSARKDGDVGAVASLTEFVGALEALKASGIGLQASGSVTGMLMGMRAITGGGGDVGEGFIERAPSTSASLKRKTLIERDAAEFATILRVASPSLEHVVPPMLQDIVTQAPRSNTPIDEFILQLMHDFPSLAYEFSTIGQRLKAKGNTIELLKEWDAEGYKSQGLNDLCAGIMFDELRRDANGVRLDLMMSDICQASDQELRQLQAEHEAVFAPIFLDLDSLLLKLSEELGIGFYSEIQDAIVATGDAPLVDGTIASPDLAQTFSTISRCISELFGFDSATLDSFRGLAIVELSLTRSLQRKESFEIEQLLSIFSLGNSFIALTNLDLSSISFFDSTALRHLQGLPLEKLNLSSTEIRSSSIAVLLPLSWSLTHLYLSNNVGIDDDAIPSLNLLSHLVHLDVNGTSIGPRLKEFILFATILQPSLLRVVAPAYFVKSLQRSTKALDLSVVTDLSQISQLTKRGIKEQLRSHDGALLVSGNSTELKQRLICVVQDRLDDIVSCEMISGGE